jgi:hypothetical protein
MTLMIIIIEIVHDYTWGSMGKIHGSGRGEIKGYQGVKKMEVCSIPTYEDNIMKATKHFERGVRGRRGDENIKDGMNLFKTHIHMSELSQ